MIAVGQHLIHNYIEILDEMGTAGTGGLDFGLGCLERRLGDPALGHLAFQAPDQGPLPEDPVDLGGQFIGLERLADKVDAAGVDDLRIDPLLVMAGDDDDIGAGPALLHQIHEFHAAQARHPQIGHHHVHRALFEQVHRLGTVHRRGAGVALGRENGGDDFPDTGIVIHHQDAAALSAGGRHRLYRVSFRYLIRWGRLASTPKRRFRSSSYSE